MDDSSDTPVPSEPDTGGDLKNQASENLLRDLFLLDPKRCLLEIDKDREGLARAIYNAAKGGLSPEEVKDVLQETYHAVLRITKDEIRDIKSYVYRIAINKAKKAVDDDVKKNKAQEDLEVIQQGFHLPSGQDDHALAHKLKQFVIANLPSDDLRTVFENSLSRERTREELAAELGKTPRQVKRLRETVGEFILDISPKEIDAWEPYQNPPR